MDDKQQQFQMQQPRPQNDLSKFIMPLVVIVVVMALVEVGVHYARKAIIGDPVANLSSNAINTAVAQSLSNGGTIPVAGKNYTIQQVNFFEGNDWAVVTIQPLHNDGSGALVVVQKSGDKYNTILGPGSSFTLSTLPKLPTPVLYYLNSHGFTVNNTVDD